MLTFIALWTILELLLIASGAFLASCLALTIIRHRDRNSATDPTPPASNDTPILSYAGPALPRFARHYRLVLFACQLVPATVGIALPFRLARLGDFPRNYIIVAFVLGALGAAVSCLAAYLLVARTASGDRPRLCRIRRRAGILTLALLFAVPLSAWGAQHYACWRVSRLYAQCMARAGVTEELLGKQRTELLAIRVPRVPRLSDDNPHQPSASDTWKTAITVLPAREQTHKAVHDAIAEIERSHGQAINLLPGGTANNAYSADQPGSITYDLPFLLLDETRRLLAEGRLPEALRCFRDWRWLVEDIARNLDTGSIEDSLASREEGRWTLEALLPLIHSEPDLEYVSAPESLRNNEFLSRYIDMQAVAVARNDQWEVGKASWVSWAQSLWPRGRRRFFMGRRDNSLCALFVTPDETASLVSDLRTLSDRAKRGELWQSPPDASSSNTHNAQNDIHELVPVILKSEETQTLWRSALKKTRLRLQRAAPVRDIRTQSGAAEPQPNEDHSLLPLLPPVQDGLNRSKQREQRLACLCAMRQSVSIATNRGELIFAQGPKI